MLIHTKPLSALQVLPSPGSLRAPAAGMARAPFVDLLVSAIYFAIGFAPITALAISLFGFLPLSVSALALVFPAAVLGLALGCAFPQYGRLALKGFLMGVIAVAIYDAVRAPFIVLGV